MAGTSGATEDLTNTYSYTAFGTVRDRTGPSEQPYQYVVNAYDSTTRLADLTIVPAFIATKGGGPPRRKEGLAVRVPVSARCVYRIPGRASVLRGPRLSVERRVA